MSITIFLADDHAVVRDGLRMLLEVQPDFKVIGEAATGRDTIDRVSRQCPRVLILDIAMPELNGIEVAQQLREPCPSTQVVILSMYATAEHIFRALRAGVRGYLLKESAGGQVVEAVRTVDAGQRYLSPKIFNQVVKGYLQQTEAIAAKSPLDRLSPREREILQLVVEGSSSVDIGEKLSLSPKTVETYRSRLMQKLNINDLPTLVKFAIQYGLTSLE